MSLSLSSKLLAALIGVCTFAICGMGLASYLSFNQGFLGYLNDQAVARMESAQARFERAYAKTGSWHFLENSHSKLWFDLLAPENFREANPGQPLLSDLAGAVLRITLLDARHQYVKGYRGVGSQPSLLPLYHKKQVIGWLAMTPFESVSAAGYQRFQTTQIQSSLLIGMLCLLTVTGISWWISQTLLRPVRRVAKATQDLTQGNYQIQVPVTSRDEAGLLAKNFNAMARTLAEHEQKRRNFMADISHELRTPLAVLRGELEALEDGVRQFDVNGCKSLQYEVQALNKLVDDLFELSLAEIGGSTYCHESFDLEECLQDLLKIYTSRFNARHLSLSFTPSGCLPVVGDEGRLTQLLSNLLENSLRYTHPQGELHIHTMRQGTVLRIYFDDSPPCVPEADLPQLFDRFYRVEHSRSRQTGGAGLGLAICQGIAEVHGGTLSASASPLGGLRITLALPVTQVDEPV